MNFEEIKKSGEIIIYSPLKGEVKSLEDIPDLFFTSYIIGDGCAINPVNGVIHAPVSSKVKIFKTNHLLIFEPEKGVHVVIHFGIGTSHLKGKGFTRLLKEEGREVNAGDEIISCDLNYINNKARSTITPIIVNNENISRLELLVKHGEIVESGAPLMRIYLK